jgi:hypothetical protein
MPILQQSLTVCQEEIPITDFEPVTSTVATDKNSFLKKASPFLYCSIENERTNSLGCSLHM